jgi:MYXO-CTERM domain-containing protein
MKTMRNLFHDRSLGFLRRPLWGASLAVASLLATTAPALAQSNRSIINGGFELPDVGLNGVFFFDEGAVPGWETTATDGQMEFWGSGFNSVPAFEGDQFVELNAFEVATLFQPLCLVPGDVVNWSFAHRGRLGNDTLRLTIGPDVITTVTTGTADWSPNSGTYTPTLTASAPVQFFFESVDAAGGSAAAGNFLDAVEIVLPPHYELSTAAGSDAEGTGGNLPVLLVSGTLTSLGSVTVAVSGTATPGTDFTFNTTVSIPAGEYDGTPATAIPLGIAIIEDTAVEADETIVITISNATGENDGNPARIADVDCNNTALATATYTITNDDVTPCGNGQVEDAEGCDDGNITAGDGCSSTCTVESGFICTGAPSLCCSGLASTFASVGNATLDAATNEVIVVPNLGFQKGAVWFGQTFDLATAFDYRFKISFGSIDGAGADGFGFVFHRDPRGLSAVGDAGQGLGASNITPSLVVEFDTFDNGVSEGDVAADHTAVFADNNDDASDFIVIDPGPPAATTVCLKADCSNIEDGEYHDARIVWQPAPTPTLTVFLDDQQLFALQRDIAATDFDGDPRGIFFGFTASTGGATNEHKFCPQRLIADLDFDQDDTSNSVDIDSDDDGIPDLDEVSGLDGDPDADGDGDAVPDWNDPDEVDCTSTNGAPAECARGSLPATIDFDGDGAPNHLDLDSDNDGILDVEEAGHTAIDPVTGRVSCPDGAGSNGLCDALEASAGTLSYTIANTDDDTAPDFLDLDTDGDGISDRVEGGPRCPAGTDAQVCDLADKDLDGVSDASDDTPGLGIDVSDTPLPDTDGDNVPDFRDLPLCGDGSGDHLDADEDGVPDDCDVCAGGDDVVDADADGTPDGCDVCAMDVENDADSDGICESDDNCPLLANPDQSDGNADGTGDACSPRYGLQGGGCSATSGAAGGWNALLILLALLLIHRWSRRRELRAA